MIALQLLLILGFPILALTYQQRSRWSKWLSAIVLCYLVGILLRNATAFPIHEAVARQASEISILLAIPLLLFSTRLEEMYRFARQGLRSFLLCIVAGLFSCLAATFLFQDQIEEAWKLGGMLVGIYTGGTPNMQAVGLAVQAPQSYIILLNAADIFSGGIYLILLTSILPGLLARFLPPFDPKLVSSENANFMEPVSVNWKDSTVRWNGGYAFLLAIAVLAVSLGFAMLIFGSLEQVAFIMLCLTSLAIGASFLPRVRRWQGTYELGEYFLLVFCVALGLQADFSSMLMEGRTILIFTSIAMLGTILIHLLLARLFKVDRDTFLISSTAALYGPAFIGQIASVIGNRQLLFTGMALGLLGYALGNYLGIGLAQVLYWWLG